MRIGSVCNIILLALFAAHFLHINAKNTKSQAGNFKFKYLTINSSCSDEKIISGKSYILDNKVYMNFTIYKEIHGYVKILILGQFQRKQRILFNKTLDSCVLAGYQKSKDLIFRILIMPVLEETKISLCPTKKVS